VKIVDSATMRRFDGTAIKRYGIPGLVLMENAGKGIAQIVEKDFGNLKGKRVSIFAGKGNNGGDGFVVARHLLNKGFKVCVYLLARPQDVHGDAKTNLNIWEKIKGETVSIVNQRSLLKGIK